MLSLLIALIVFGFAASLVWWLVQTFAPEPIKFPLTAATAVVFVIGLLVLIGRSGLLRGL